MSKYTYEEREEFITEAWEKLYSVVDYLDWIDRQTVKTAVNDLIKLHRAQVREECSQ